MTPQTVQIVVKSLLRRLKFFLSADDLEDLCQDVHVELLRLRQRYDESKGNWKSYAFCRIKGAILDRVRSKAREPKARSLYESDAVMPPSDEDTWKTVARSTGSFLLEERFRHRYKITELAKKYGVHKSTIRNWIDSQLQTLRTELK